MEARHVLHWNKMVLEAITNEILSFLTKTYVCITSYNNYHFPLALYRQDLRSDWSHLLNIQTPWYSRLGKKLSLPFNITVIIRHTGHQGPNSLVLYLKIKREKIDTKKMNDHVNCKSKPHCNWCFARKLSQSIVKIEQTEVCSDTLNKVDTVVWQRVTAR